MYWGNFQIWKQSVNSTLICLVGCSIGTLTVEFFFNKINNWFLVLFATYFAGLISCLVFVLLWEIVFNKMELKNAFKHSYKMSFSSILIMVVSENFIMLYVFPEFSTNSMQMNLNYEIREMLVAMSFGFFLSLPYNYYQLQKKNNK